MMSSKKKLKENNIIVTPREIAAAHISQSSNNHRAEHGASFESVFSDVYAATAVTSDFPDFFANKTASNCARDNISVVVIVVINDDNIVSARGGRGASECRRTRSETTRTADSLVSRRRVKILFESAAVERRSDLMELRKSWTAKTSKSYSRGRSEADGAKGYGRRGCGRVGRRYEKRRSGTCNRGADFAPARTRAVNYPQHVYRPTTNVVYHCGGTFRRTGGMFRSRRGSR